MTEKRFTTDNGSNEDVCLVDNLTRKEYEDNFDDGDEDSGEED